MLNYIVIGMGLAFASVVQPGPFQAFLLSQSLTNGWRKTFPLAFAPLLTDGPIIALVLLVLTNLPSGFLKVLQIAGGLLLFYIAYGAYKSWRTYDPSATPVASTQTNVVKAVLINFVNPNPYLGWSLVMGPLLLKAWKDSPAAGITFLFVFYTTMILCTLAMVYLFAAARKLGAQLTKIAIGVSAFALAVFGIYQIYSGIF